MHVAIAPTAAQTPPHDPQWFGSLLVSKQVPPQHVPLFGHWLLFVQKHWPFWHDWPIWQKVPQLPQLLGSLETSTHAVPHIWFGAVQPPEHIEMSTVQSIRHEIGPTEFGLPVADAQLSCPGRNCMPSHCSLPSAMPLPQM